MSASGDPDAFADAPLFRELQRVMSSSSGPVNWELARQVGIANAQEGRDDPAPTDEDRRGFEEAVRVAEMHVARFTGLEAPTDVAEIRTVRRADWVNASTQSLRELVEPAAARMATAMSEATREALGPDVPEEMRAVGGMFEQLSPLLLGAQVGTVLGCLGQRRHGPVRHRDPPVRTRARSCSSCRTSRSSSATGRSTPRTSGRRSRSTRWPTASSSRGRGRTCGSRELLADFLSTLKIDVEAMQERLATLDPSNPRRCSR